MKKILMLSALIFVIESKAMSNNETERFIFYCDTLDESTKKSEIQNWLRKIFEGFDEKDFIIDGEDIRGYCGVDLLLESTRKKTYDADQRLGFDRCISLVAAQFARKNKNELKKNFLYNVNEASPVFYLSKEGEQNYNKHFKKSYSLEEIKWQHEKLEKRFKDLYLEHQREYKFKNSEEEKNYIKLHVDKYFEKIFNKLDGQETQELKSYCKQITEHVSEIGFVDDGIEFEVCFRKGKSVYYGSPQMDQFLKNIATAGSLFPEHG